MTPDEANKIISKRKGECRHEWEQIAQSYNLRFTEYECKLCHGRVTLKGNEVLTSAISYSDLETWTQELYTWIEDEGLHVRFVQELTKRVECQYRFSGPFYWLAMYLFLKSTPEQKAIALAHAIKRAQ